MIVQCLLSKLKNSSLFLSSVAVKPGLSDRLRSSEGRLFRNEGQMKRKIENNRIKVLIKF